MMVPNASPDGMRIDLIHPGYIDPMLTVCDTECPGPTETPRSILGRTSLFGISLGVRETCPLNEIEPQETPVSL